jgi:flagellin-like protein
VTVPDRHPSSTTDRGQSEVLSVVLLVGVVVVTAGVAGVVFLDGLAAESGPATDVRASVGTDSVTLVHNGGSVVDTADLRVVLRRNETTLDVDWADGTLAGDGDGRFEPAERWRADGLGVDPGDTVRVVLVHEPSGTVVVEVVRSVPAP